MEISKYCYFGNFAWKPLIILYMLNKSNDNDIILYRDINFNKYPNVLNGNDNYIKLIDKIMKNTDLFVPIENYPDIKYKNHVKKEIFEYFDCYNNDYLESYLHNASIIICRKNNKTINFIKEWLYYCGIERLISDNLYIKQHKDFRWCTQDQSILNILLKKIIMQVIFLF